MKMKYSQQVCLVKGRGSSTSVMMRMDDSLETGSGIIAGVTVLLSVAVLIIVWFQHQGQLRSPVSHLEIVNSCSLQLNPVVFFHWVVLTSCSMLLTF